MKFEIPIQENYSRGELLLRTFFGSIYILFPHSFLLMFVGIWGSILTFISFWIIMFTGRYPESFYHFQVGLIRWSTRVNASLMNLRDGYPAFGVNSEDDMVQIDIPYPESLSRGTAILKLLFGGIYVGIPHGFILSFRMFATAILGFLSWWAILFTGKYPESWHDFNVGTLRWGFRVSLYMNFLTDVYPPFTGLRVSPEFVPGFDPDNNSEQQAESAKDKWKEENPDNYKPAGLESNNETNSDDEPKDNDSSNENNEGDKKDV